MMNGKKLSRREFLSRTAVAGVGLVLAACSPQEAPQPTSAPAEATQAPAATEAAAATVAATEPATAAATAAPAQLTAQLLVWTYSNADNDLDTIYKPMMAKFNEIQPKITVNFDIQGWGGRREKLYSAVAAGAPPDIWFATTDTLLTYVAKQVAAPLNDYITPDLLTDYPKDILDAGTVDGKLYILSTWALIYGYNYNSKLMEACGYDYTKPSMTWDELVGLGEKAKSLGYYVETISLTDWMEWCGTVRQAGGTVFNDDKATTNMTKAPAIAALTRWVEEYKNGYVPMEYSVADDASADKLPKYFQMGKQLITSHAGAADCMGLLKTDPNFPVVSGGPRQKDANSPLVAGSSGGNGWSMTQLCKSKDAAAEWIKFMIKPENIGWFCTLGNLTPVGTESQKYWKADPCVKSFIDRQAKYLFSGLDIKLLWQESKTVCAPHFQAAVLGKETVEQALEACDKALVDLLQKTYGNA